MLVDLDQRPNAVKASFDISNAHKEFCREAAVKEVQTHIPTMLPWLKGHLVTEVSHVYLGDDGTHHTIKKSRGGDQGDAATAILVPLVYRKVTLALRLGATTVDPDAREYAYQDDAELICTMPALAAASAAFDEACKSVALRANLSETTVTLGRGVDVSTIPPQPPHREASHCLQARWRDGLGRPRPPRH